VRLPTITLRRESSTPLYRQLFEQLQTRILTGELTPGMRLPSARMLSDELHIARISVENAYHALENAGYVLSRDRRGWFVAETVKRSQAGASTLAPVLQDGDFVASSAPISFSAGNLPAEFMPVAAMRHALNFVLDRDQGDALGYEPTEGYEPLRAAIATHVHQLGIRAKPGQILVTGGCQQAIDLAVQSLVPQGGALLTTDPTYIGLIDIARMRGIELLTVPFEGAGLDFDALDRLIEQKRPHLFYLMTNFHNPTGGILAPEVRRRLLRWAELHQLPLLEDGVYDGLSYMPDVQTQPLRASDDTGIVLYASGFSKTVVPGTRIGYLIAGERYFDRLRGVKQAADVCTPGLNQRAMTVLLENGTLNAHLEWVRRACRQRRDALVTALQPLKAHGWQFAIPAGGLYLWLTLPQTDRDATALLTVARQQHVDFAPGAEFSPLRRWSHSLRLNFTSHAPPVIAEGINRLWRAYQETV
jgi:DNA-binding transcriptional MocR family regulator